MSQSTISALLSQGVKANFIRALNGMDGKDLVSRLCTVAPSSARDETYGWLGQPPVMEEAGSSTASGSATVPVKALSEGSYTITNKKFWASIAVDRDDWADDQARGLPLRVQQLAQVALAHRNKLVTSMLTGGTSNLCYDGTAFFGNSHPARKDEGGTQDNLLAGTGTSTAQISTDFNTAISTMLGFIAENGEPFHASGTSRFAVVAPPALMKPMKEALGASIISNTSNVQFDGLSVDVIFEPRLAATDANDWYLLHVGGGLRPLIFQDREPLTLEDTRDGDAAVLQEQYIFKARARYNVGYGFWQDACKVVNS